MTNDYKQKILEYLEVAAEPADIEKIRSACGIGNWNTALKHCLELHAQGAVQGQKTSKGWTFWVYEARPLNIWEEAIGTLDKVENSETQTIAFLTCIYRKQIAIPLPKNQPETEKLQKLQGKKISILKTDVANKPIIIRSLNEPAITHSKKT